MSKDKVTVTVNRKSVSAQYHAFPGITLTQTSGLTGHPCLFGIASEVKSQGQLL